MLALLVDVQGRFVDFDGDDLASVTQPDLDALVDDWVPAAGHGAPHLGGAVVEERLVG